MKKFIKNQPFAVFLTFAIIAFITIAAYTGSKLIHPNPGYNHVTKLVEGGGPIKLSAGLNNKYFYDNNQLYLYVDLKADKVEGGKERTPLNVAVVIDKSGSMADKKKMEYVKKSVEYIIDQLGSDDYVSVVTYDDYVSVLQRSERMRDKYALRDKISNVYPGGYTNLSGGMFEGYDQVNSTYSRGYVNRVLLLSDGLANVGITDRYELAKKVRDKNRRDGITISTFGVGNDFNENLMADLADYGKGNYYYIRNSNDIPDIFASELNGIKNMVGQGTKVRIHFPEEYLLLNKVYGYPYEIEGDDIVIDFKDVFSDQNRAVLVKFDVKKRIDRKLEFNTELTYDDVTANLRSVKEKNTCEVEPVRSQNEFDKGYDDVVRQNVAVFEANDLMEQALKDADDGNYADAKKKLQAGQEYMSGQMNEVAPSPEMRRQQENMDKYEKDLESANSKTDEEKKEMQKSGKYDNYNSRKKNQ